MKYTLTLILLFVASLVNAQSRLKIDRIKVTDRDTITSLVDSAFTFNFCELIMERGAIMLGTTKYVNRPMKYHIVVKMFTDTSRNNEDYGLAIYTDKKVSECDKSYVIPIHSHVTTEVADGDLHKIIVVLDDSQFRSLYHLNRIDLVTKNKLYVFQLEKHEQKRIKMVHKEMMK